MKVEDLRIGNIVAYDDKIVKVVGIEERGVHVLIDPLQSYFHIVPINDLEPIPLTEEIISNCGFVKFSFIENHYRIAGMMVWKCNDIFLCDRNGIIIKNLNQLQNLYYSLTSQELKYNE